MGNHLADWFGDSYVPVGVVCYECAMTTEWMAITPGDLTDYQGAPIVEVLLHDLGQDLLFLDLAPPTRIHEALPSNLHCGASGKDAASTQRQAAPDFLPEYSLQTPEASTN